MMTQCEVKTSHQILRKSDGINAINDPNSLNGSPYSLDVNLPTSSVYLRFIQKHHMHIVFAGFAGLKSSPSVYCKRPKTQRAKVV